MHYESKQFENEWPGQGVGRMRRVCQMYRCCRSTHCVVTSGQAREANAASVCMHTFALRTSSQPQGRRVRVTTRPVQVARGGSTGEATEDDAAGGQAREEDATRVYRCTIAL